MIQTIKYISNPLVNYSVALTFINTSVAARHNKDTSLKLPYCHRGRWLNVIVLEVWLLFSHVCTEPLQWLHCFYEPVGKESHTTLLWANDISPPGSTKPMVYFKLDEETMMINLGLINALFVNCSCSTVYILSKSLCSSIRKYMAFSVDKRRLFCTQTSSLQKWQAA